MGTGFGLDWLATVGPVLLWVVVLGFVFIECALILGLFLPGDSLLFIAGLILAQESAGDVQVWALALSGLLAAIVGNRVGYFVGDRTGTRFISHRDGKVLNQRNLDRAHEFLERWGFLAIVAARWIPYVRTLAPMLAGVARMNMRRFMVSTTVGAIIWVPTLVLIGFYGAGLIAHMPWLTEGLIWVSVGFFVISTTYGVIRYRKETRKPVAEDPA
ncbi:DedA family protein [Prauserella halophila]|uniref:DedA family protein n=2 Tax=Prauserella halophila TaxID=185641 RepID=A0ABN1W963_9PSEU|nr:VTT domain-containing protein [Prauserella halophila]MCP2236867.1 membrane-associated protein [Prauserella halophila]